MSWLIQNILWEKNSESDNNYAIEITEVSFKILNSGDLNALNVPGFTPERYITFHKSTAPTGWFGRGSKDSNKFVFATR
jgi:hypothetical protein